MEPGIFTIILVVLTVLTSIKAFSDGKLYDNFLFWPRRMNQLRDYHRFLSHGFIHLDWMHLIFNMIALWSFGSFIEFAFTLTGVKLAYPLLYLTGIIAASVPSFYKHRNDPSYRALGASGGVSAVVFASVALNPWGGVSFFFIPRIPGIVFAVLYLLFSAYMSRKGDRTVGHDAHFWGSVYGFVFTIIAIPGTLQSFIYQLQHPQFH